MPAHNPNRRLLVVASPDDDYLGLRRMLNDLNWNCEWAQTCAEALPLLDEENIPIVICEHRLPDGGWRDVLDGTSLTLDPPIVIVAAKELSEPFYEEVRESGAHDVLLRPFEHDDVLEILANARREHHARALRTGNG